MIDRLLPETLVYDNGSEFISKAAFYWARTAGLTCTLSNPGIPTQSAFVESFDGKFRHSYLNLNWLSDLVDAKHLDAAL